MARTSPEPTSAPTVGRAAVRSYHFKYLRMQVGTACAELTLLLQKERFSLKMTHMGSLHPA